MITINGTQIAAPDSYKVTIADLDSSANRSGDGTLYRDRVAVKRTIDMSWLIIDAQELSVLLNSVSEVYFIATYLDPQTNSYRTGEFYVSNRDAGVAVKNSDGSYTWKNVAFPIVER